MRKAVFVLCCLVVTLASCVQEPNYPAIPQITFQQITSSNVQSNALDTLIFSFTDGDGDISVNSNSIDTSCSEADACNLKSSDSACLRIAGKNIFMIDPLGCVTAFASPNLVPTGKYKGIAGSMNVFFNVENLICPICSGSTPCNTNVSSNPYGIDTIVYTVLIRDMAGHFSNAIQTTPIVVSCLPQ